MPLLSGADRPPLAPLPNTSSAPRSATPFGGAASRADPPPFPTAAAAPGSYNDPGPQGGSGGPASVPPRGPGSGLARRRSFSEFQHDQLDQQDAGEYYTRPSSRGRGNEAGNGQHGSGARGTGGAAFTAAGSGAAGAGAGGSGAAGAGAAGSGAAGAVAGGSEAAGAGAAGSGAAGAVAAATAALTAALLGAVGAAGAGGALHQGGGGQGYAAPPAAGPGPGSHSGDFGGGRGAVPFGGVAGYEGLIGGGAVGIGAGAGLGPPSCFGAPGLGGGGRPGGHPGFGRVGSGGLPGRFGGGGGGPCVPGPGGVQQGGAYGGAYDEQHAGWEGVGGGVAAAEGGGAAAYGGHMVGDLWSLYRQPTMQDRNTIHRLLGVPHHAPASSFCIAKREPEPKGLLAEGCLACGAPIPAYKPVFRIAAHPRRDLQEAGFPGSVPGRGRRASFGSYSRDRPGPVLGVASFCSPTCIKNLSPHNAGGSYTDGSWNSRGLPLPQRMAVWDVERLVLSEGVWSAAQHAVNEGDALGRRGLGKPFLEAVFGWIEDEFEFPGPLHEAVDEVYRQQRRG